MTCWKDVDAATGALMPSAASTRTNIRFRCIAFSPPHFSVLRARHRAKSCTRPSLCSNKKQLLSESPQLYHEFDRRVEISTKIATALDSTLSDHEPDAAAQRPVPCTQ